MSIQRLLVVASLALAIGAGSFSSALAQEKDPFKGVFMDGKNNNLIMEPCGIESLKGVVDYQGSLTIDGKAKPFNVAKVGNDKLFGSLGGINEKGGPTVMIIRKGQQLDVDVEKLGKFTFDFFAENVEAAKAKLGGGGAAKPEKKPNPLEGGGMAEEHTDPFTGLFKNPKLTLQITGVEGKYQGTITMGETKFPLTAKKQGEKVAGSFTSGDNSFDFTLTRTEQGVKLVTGSTEYDLARAGKQAGTPEVVKDPAKEEVIPAGKVKLVQRWVPGDYRTESTASVEDNMGNLVTRQSNGSAANMRIAPPGADGLQKVTLVITRMRQTIDAAGTRLELDTSNPGLGNHPARQVVPALLNTPYELTINAEGRVDSIKGLDEALEKIGAQNEAAGAMLRGMKDDIRIGLESVLMGNVSSALPKKPVGEGDTWNAKLRVTPPRMPESLAKGTGKLAKLNGNSAMVTFDGEIEPAEKLPPGYAMETKLHSEMHMDAATGMVRAGVTTSDILIVAGPQSRKIKVVAANTIEPAK